MSAAPGIAPPPLPARDGFAPVESARRIQVLDVARGFALLGIFLMNIEWFTRPLQQLGTGVDPQASGLDRVAAWLVYVFVQGKFWVLFSLLFGMGFAVMSARGGHGAAFRRTYVRRCVALLAIGLLHALLLWTGDILHAYALAGVALLLFAAVGDRVLLWLGLAIYVGTSLMIAMGGGLLSIMPAEELAEFATMAAEAESDAAIATQAFVDGSYWQVTLQRMRDFASVALPGATTTVPAALGVFMVGAWLVRSGRVHDVAAQRGWYAKLAAWTLPLGAVFIALSLQVGTYFDGMRDVGPWMLALGLLMLGSLPLSLGYFALLVLGLGVPALGRVLGWLAPAGRMALTNYLLQSLVASTLFYGYGFGLWGQVGRTGQVGLVFVVFVLQVLASHWWLARHRFGPVEWLWRWMTYGTRPPMRHA